MDHYFHLYFVFVMLFCLFIAALWSPSGKRLTPWPSYMGCYLAFFVAFQCVVLGQVWYLIVLISDLCLLNYFVYGLSLPVKYFTDRSKAVLLLWIFYVFVLSCVCTSVYMCFGVTCWERADLLALVCGVYYEFVSFPLVSWVRCGT